MIKCEFENGSKGYLRHVVVDAIVVNKEETEVLLEKRSDKVDNAGKWCMPGGFLNRDEDIREGIAREIKEETGHDVLKLELFKIITNQNRQGEDRQNVTFVFIATCKKQEIKSDDEVEKIKWFSFSEIPKEEDLAFDHADSIKLFLKHKENNFNLPIVD